MRTTTTTITVTTTTTTAIITTTLTNHLKTEQADISIERMSYLLLMKEDQAADNFD